MPTPKKPTLTSRVAALEGNAHTPQAASLDPSWEARNKARAAAQLTVESCQSVTQTAILAAIRNELEKKEASTQRVLNLASAFAQINAYRY